MFQILLEQISLFNDENKHNCLSNIHKHLKLNFSHHNLGFESYASMANAAVCHKEDSEHKIIIKLSALKRIKILFHNKVKPLLAQTLLSLVDSICNCL